jgi:membrane-associated phospholipid phosphatase
MTVYSDLRLALGAGASRTRARTPDGGRWLGAWALTCALAGVALYLAGGYQAGFLRLNGLAAGAPDWVWQWLTMLGDERVAFALTLFFSRRWPRVFWALVLAALVGIAYTHSLKPLVGALRPPGVLPADAFNLIGPEHRQGSFPSGHTVTAAVFFGVWVYYLRSAPLRLLLILLAVAAGVSRVAVGVHWPVDVAAGLAGGALAAWAGASLAARAEWGARDPTAHLAFVALAAMISVSLLWWDGGYGGAARMQQVLGLAALGYAAYAYLLSPLVLGGYRSRPGRVRVVSSAVWRQCPAGEAALVAATGHRRNRLVRADRWPVRVPARLAYPIPGPRGTKKSSGTAQE